MVDLSAFAALAPGSGCVAHADANNNRAHTPSPQQARVKGAKAPSVSLLSAFTVIEVIAGSRMGEW